jgi:hypothetical protein
MGWICGPQITNVRGGLRTESGSRLTRKNDLARGRRGNGTFLATVIW